MVEGARLESVYTGNCIKGSNPFVSASQTVDIMEIPSLCGIPPCFRGIAGRPHKGDALTAPTPMHF